MLIRGVKRRRNIQDTKAEKTSKTKLNPQVHLQRKEDSNRHNRQDEIGRGVEHALHVSRIGLHIRTPALARLAHGIPETVHVAALREDGDGGEEVDDQLLRHQGVEEPPAGLGIAEEAEHEVHKGDTAESAAHDCCVAVSLRFERRMWEMRNAPKGSDTKTNSIAFTRCSSVRKKKCRPHPWVKVSVCIVNWRSPDAYFIYTSIPFV